MRRLVVDLTVPRDPKVVFEGAYINKVELEAVLRGIRKAHKRMIYEYRRNKIIADYESKKLKEKEEVKNGTDGKSETSGSAGAGAGAESISVGGGVNKTVSPIGGDSGSVKSG